MSGVDLSRCQNAFPLPYGENLGETEAFHLIRAFELYNELRTLVSDIQALDIRELPVRRLRRMAMVLMSVMQVMLLVMMITFFKLPPSKPPGPAVYLEQPERVERVHQFYLDKLHAYLQLRCGAAGSVSPRAGSRPSPGTVKFSEVPLTALVCDIM